MASTRMFALSRAVSRLGSRQALCRSSAWAPSVSPALIGMAPGQARCFSRSCAALGPASTEAAEQAQERPLGKPPKRLSIEELAQAVYHNLGQTATAPQPRGGSGFNLTKEASGAQAAARQPTTAPPAGSAAPPSSADVEAPGIAVPTATEEGDGRRPIYLDYQATTPTDPRVVHAILPYFSEHFGNPHSRTHLYGWESEAAVERARADVATLVGADPKEIVFTSGATESNNLALKGVARFYRRARGKKHVITTQTEHKCVLDSCRYLQEDGFDVTYLPVGTDGLVDPQQLAAAIRDDTALVSVMTVNNEIGVIQPVAELGRICRERKVFFHTDAAQAVGKIPVDVNSMNIDLMSISGHKIYGPKGIGALYVRRRPRVRLEPLISGGGQERGLRSGTVPTPLVVGLGAACRIARAEMAEDAEHVKRLAARLERGITSQLEHVQRNGSASHGYPGCINLSFAYVEGESLLMALKDVALSSGSACTSASLEPSYVLRALGADDVLAHSSIRFGIGRFTTEQEVDAVVTKVVHAVNHLRNMSPLWEMVQEGIDVNTIQWSGH